MKYGEIKLEALRIMNINTNTNLVLDNFYLYLNEPKFQKYLSNMDNSINRAIDLINYQKVLDLKSKKLIDLKYEIKDKVIEIDLSSVDDFYEIEYVILKNKSELKYIEFFLVGDKILLNNEFDIDNVDIIYQPKLNEISLNTSYDEEVLIPNNLARVIPYYIKFDLYQEDEPVLANNSLSIFQKALNEAKKERNINSIKIDNYFAYEDLL